MALPSWEEKTYPLPTHFWRRWISQLPVWWDYLSSLEDIHLRHLEGQIYLFSYSLGGVCFAHPIVSTPQLCNKTTQLRWTNGISNFGELISFSSGWFSDDIYIYIYISFNWAWCILCAIQVFWVLHFFWERRSWKSVWNTWRMMRGMPRLLTASHVLVNLPSAWSDCQHTLPQTVSLHLKIDAWKIGISFWGKRPVFRGRWLLALGMTILWTFY